MSSSVMKKRSTTNNLFFPLQTFWSTLDLPTNRTVFSLKNWANASALSSGATSVLPIVRLYGISSVPWFFAILTAFQMPLLLLLEIFLLIRWRLVWKKWHFISLFNAFIVFALMGQYATLIVSPNIQFVFNRSLVDRNRGLIVSYNSLSTSKSQQSKPSSTFDQQVFQQR